MDNLLNHLVFYEIQTAKPLPYRFLFDDVITELFNESNEFKYSNIYFFCKQKKVRFNLEKTRILDNKSIITELLIGKDQKKQVYTNLFEVSRYIQELFESPLNFLGLNSNRTDTFLNKLNLNDSDSGMLKLSIKNIAMDKTIYYELIPDNFLYMLDLDINDPPEIVYIGQSFRMLDRIQSHKTLHKAVSKLKDHEELKIFFLTFKYGYGGDNTLANLKSDISQLWLSQHGKNKTFAKKIDLVERFLIHFFKPEYNKQHVNCSIEEDNLVKDILIENNIKAIGINYGVYGNNFEFWSKDQPLKEEMVVFDFTNPEKGYTNFRQKNK